MSWKKEYEVNIGLVDQQHRRLFELLEMVRDSLLGRTSTRAVYDSMDMLTRYTETHFLTEERLMRLHGYPDLDGHRKEHQAFAERVSKYQAEFLAGETKGADELYQVLLSWWNGHILGTDKKYCRHFADKGIH